ncbi:MAG TPA: DJ-1 family protein, partial [Methylophaga sp.]|nr:DJ-1 family protein [Methylophaga sp.]
MPAVLIPLAEGCEELEAVTLIDLLRRADFTVVTASLTKQQQVTASRGVRLVADVWLED